MKRMIGILLAVVMTIVATGTFAEAEILDTKVAYTKYGWVTTAAKTDESRIVTVGITLAGETAETTFTTSIPLDTYNDQSYEYESDAVAAILDVDTFAEVYFNIKDEVIGFERVLRGVNKDRYYLDSIKYGGELTAPGGSPGSMVAQGWVLDKGENTITFGDGNELVKTFNETYTLAEDCKVFLVDNPGFDTTQQESNEVEVGGTWASTPASLEDAKLCPRGEDGTIYRIPTRYTAMAIFDQSAVDEDGKTKADVSEALVKELYIYAHHQTLRSRDLAAPDGVGYNGTSWFSGVDQTVEKTSSGWNGSCEPFAAQEGRVYSIGDAFTNIFLYVSDPDENGDPTLTLLDMGNATSSYQYYINMEKMGYDPRAVDRILLTHGHGDHYGALWELVTMVNRAAGFDKVEVYTSGADQAGYLAGKYTGITLNSKPERYMVDYFNEWHTWMDFGKGVQVYAFPTPGHANDVASFIFLMNIIPDDPYFSKIGVTEGKVAWVYMGGYGGGASTKAENGYTRLQYTYSMKYMQSWATKLAGEVADFMYNLPQHADQGPWYEVAKTVRIKNEEGANLTFLDGWVEGADGIKNLMEKRLSGYNNLWLNSAYKATQDTNGEVPVSLFDQIIVPYIREAGYSWYSSAQNMNTEATDVFGPFKRAAGTYIVDVDSVTIVHGFDAFQNQNKLLKGVENIYGWDVSKGIPVMKDSYAHDPNGWYVQFICKVEDDYIGGVYFTEEDAKGIAELDNMTEAYPVNFVVADGGQYKAFDNSVVVPKSGPVESMTGENWMEILRTQRLNSKEEAQAVEAYLNELIAAGKTRFQVNLNIASDVVLPENYISAANAPLDDPFLKSLNDDSIKVTFPGTGYYSVEEEAKVIEKAMELNQGIDLNSMFVPVE